MQVRFTEQLAEAIKASANTRLTSTNSWIRQACLAELAKESLERRREQTLEVRA
jgi:hypothetical protein